MCKLPSHSELACIEDKGSNEAQTGGGIGSLSNFRMDENRAKPYFETQTTTSTESFPRLQVHQTRLEYLESVIEKLREKYDRLLVANIELSKKNQEMAEILAKRDENLISAVEQIFTAGQIAILKNPKRTRGSWSSLDIAEALSLHAAGPRAYRLLKKKGYPLPGESTLRSWKAAINLEPGILYPVLELMKSCHFEPLDRVCCIMGDEMSIRKCYEYDKKNDTLHGPTSHVQVLMARGVFKSWRQPLYYDFDTKLSKSLIFSTIEELHRINYEVRVLVTDMGPDNQGLLKELGVTKEEPWFINPCDGERVYVFADVPHLVKLIRNHFLDKDFTIGDKIVNKAPLIELYEKTSKFDLKIAHKLTEEHLKVRHAKRQKVRLAAQVFSHTNSQAITRLGALGIAKSENWIECSDLLKTVSFNYII